VAPDMRRVRVSFVLVRVVGILALLLPLSNPAPEPRIQQRVDYVSSFYVAGRLVAEGRARDVYPDPSATSFTTAPFNVFAHELLPDLPAEDTAYFQYSPLVAALFAPFSLLTPRASMIAWQLTSIGALAACALLLAPVTGRGVGDAFWHSLLYLPVFQLLLIGHIGLPLGLLPLCAGYFLLRRGRPLWAGLAWSLLLLKPQFLPTVLLVVGALTLRGHFRSLAGFASGLAAQAVAIAVLMPGLGSRWISAIGLGDTIFTNPEYRYPTYLVVCLPGAGLPLLPLELRDPIKLAAHGIAALIGLHALWRSWRLLEATGPERESGIPFVFLLGIGVLPLVVPHLLSYDLSVVAVAGVIMTGGGWSGVLRRRLQRIGLFYLLAVDAYLAVVFVDFRLAQPLVLVGVLIVLYLWLLRCAVEAAAADTVQDEARARESAPMSRT
jgi:hypothetical protein